MVDLSKNTSNKKLLCSVILIKITPIVHFFLISNRILLNEKDYSMFMMMYREHLEKIQAY